VAILETWKRLTPPARAGLVAGAVLIVALAAGLGWWAYRTDYQVLFADLGPADAAAMTAELDKLKAPYQLADGGRTILVAKEAVYKLRLQVMGKEIPLQGAVGFEVFNNADFGMTEFVQKVNYQRAVQGELTRTILSLDKVQAARVHLALPEQGLFKKAHARPKASVTVTMKPGQALAEEQVLGIQRLVAASVPEITSADVTVLNQHGVALTRAASADGEDSGVGTANAQLDAKRGAEEYLQKKVQQVLERTFGAGAAVASIDVLLDHDQTKVTTEEVLPARGQAADAAPAGVLVHERQSQHDAGAGVAAAKPDPGSSTSESDYQAGRRVQQQVYGSGGVKRMTVAVLVKQALSEQQLAQLREVVALATGLNEARGDAIVVQSMEQFVAPAPHAGPGPAAIVNDAGAEAAPLAAQQAPASQGRALVVPALLAVLAVVLAGGVLVLRQRRQAVRRLAPAEREQLLQHVRRWMAEPSGSDGGRP
jgi:flagellar M-ring protein FliF